MKKNTRFAFNAYLQQLARLNGVAVEELSSKFTVEPSVQQTLEDQIQQSAAFLTLINVTPVTEQSGQLLGLGVGSTIAGTTDTTAKEREPVDPTLMVDVEYKCEQTNFDTVLTYAKLDLWAKFQDFQVRIRDAIVKRQALDRIMIGFIWSVRCSAQSDRSCGYCTGGRGAGCLEILATHHRISRWRGGRIQSGGRSHQCSVRTA